MGEFEGLLDLELKKIETVLEQLAATHGTPRLGNKEDPVDEVVYIILSRKTRERAYQESFSRLKERFDSWDDLLESHEDDIAKIIYSSGLNTKKAKSIVAALERLTEEFGCCTLDPVRKWEDESLLGFLCSIPGVGKKSAFCIMMYSLDREVFPVDAHVGRVLARIGLYSSIGLDLQNMNHKQRQAVLEELIPPRLRYALHVNLVAHGRKICSSRKPACLRCPVRDNCRYFEERQSQ